MRVSKGIEFITTKGHSREDKSMQLVLGTFGTKEWGI